MGEVSIEDATVVTTKANQGGRLSVSVIIINGMFALKIMADSLW